MTSKHSTKLTRPGSPGHAKGRRLIAVCLLRAISDTGSTNAGAARWLKVSETTLYTWLRLERPASVEKILDCAQLRDAFRNALCTFDHDHSASYVARKRGSK